METYLAIGKVIYAMLRLSMYLIVYIYLHKKAIDDSWNM
jgi:hypothetical protein